MNVEVIVKEKFENEEMKLTGFTLHNLENDIDSEKVIEQITKRLGFNSEFGIMNVIIDNNDNPLNGYIISGYTYSDGETDIILVSDEIWGLIEH